MKGSEHYSFVEVNVRVLPLLNRWQALPHVAEWWDADEPFDQEDLEDPRVSMSLVSFAERPFAFMQDYTVHGWGDHHFAHLPPGSRGIDQFIGEVDMIGRGHGAAFIAQRVEQLFAEGAPVVAADPHPDNARAIHIYQKLGFTFGGKERATKWGPIFPMLRTP